ncbi:MAG: HAMP domain-containing histidine kinase [Clostridia bacterium]|nr:HAMP domain-containing histidine kinase [Clostridia bacterium]
MKKLIGKTWAKVCAYFLLAVCVATVLAEGTVAVLAWEWGFYGRTNAREMIESGFGQIALEQGDRLLSLVLAGDSDRADRIARESNAEFSIQTRAGDTLWQSAGYEGLSASAWQYGGVSRYDSGTQSAVHRYDSTLETRQMTADDYTIHIRVDPALDWQDDYYWRYHIAAGVWSFRYAICWMAVLSVLAGVTCFVFLLCSAGHRAGKEGITPGYFTWLPFDLVTVAAWAAMLTAANLLWEHIGLLYSDGVWTVLCGAGIIALAVAFTLWCASLALRVKLGSLWKSTLIFRVLYLLGLLLTGIVALLRRIPLVWKTALAASAFAFLADMIIFAFRRDAEMLLFCWTAEKLVIVALVLYIALALRKLQKGGMALAAGDLEYKTDTRHMWGEFKRHGENLNSIAQGMQAAVNRQLKSERMKAELITNVSHDIKTPLTSIINYVALLKETRDAGKQREYIEVLDRQSRRLKKLTDDLVEVSKASTGNTEVHAARGSVPELLRQALGEYEDRLAAAGLETVLSLPEGECAAMFDGTLTWRAVDNLLSNACKYGQSGTRFYIDVAPMEKQILISFKNVSRNRLNIPAEELMERFVRGDSARGGEGSGLGLDIARALTEAQGGSFSIAVDGDLFKAQMALPAA